jgi:glutamate/tyrosine decarboxylase-like PLP-dependent enzyme
LFWSKAGGGDGKKNIGKLIEARHEMVNFFASKINETKEIHMMNEVTINSAAFLYVPEELKVLLEDPKRIQETVDKINNLNMRMQKRIFKEGEFYIHTFKLNDFKNVMKTGNKTIFQMQRLMLGNPLITKEDLKNLIEYIKITGQSEWETIKNEN